MWTSSTQMKYIKYELDNFDIWSASKYQSKAINAGLQHRNLLEADDFIVLVHEFHI